MTLVKHNYRPFQLMDELFNNFAVNSQQPAYVAVNVWEHSDKWQLDLVAPGYSKEDFSIETDKGLLTVRVAKKEAAEVEGVKLRRKDMSFNGFTRSFNIDEKIDAEQISASYNSGILSLTLPKKEVVKPQPRQISIN